MFKWLGDSKKAAARTLGLNRTSRVGAAARDLTQTRYGYNKPGINRTMFNHTIEEYQGTPPAGDDARAIVEELNDAMRGEMLKLREGNDPAAPYKSGKPMFDAASKVLSYLASKLKPIERGIISVTRDPFFSTTPVLWLIGNINRHLGIIREIVTDEEDRNTFVDNGIIYGRTKTRKGELEAQCNLLIYKTVNLFKNLIVIVKFTEAEAAGAAAADAAATRLQRAEEERERVAALAIGAEQAETLRREAAYAAAEPDRARAREARVVAMRQRAEAARRRAENNEELERAHTLEIERIRTLRPTGTLDREYVENPALRAARNLRERGRATTDEDRQLDGIRRDIAMQEELIGRLTRERDAAAERVARELAEEGRATAALDAARAAPAPAPEIRQAEIAQRRAVREHAAADVKLMEADTSLTAATEDLVPLQAAFAALQAAIEARRAAAARRAIGGKRTRSNKPSRKSRKSKTRSRK